MNQPIDHLSSLYQLRGHIESALKHEKKQEELTGVTTERQKWLEHSQGYTLGAIAYHKLESTGGAHSVLRLSVAQREGFFPDEVAKNSWLRSCHAN